MGINLPEPDRTEEIDDISALERRYLANLNPLEKALNLLHTKYNTMALFSAAAAAVLELPQNKPLHMVWGISRRNVSFFYKKPSRCRDSIKPYCAMCDALLG